MASIASAFQLGFFDLSTAESGEEQYDDGSDIVIPDSAIDEDTAAERQTALNSRIRTRR